MGVSGGEEGARHGPSMMPGGSDFAYQQLAPILTKIAAQVNDGPCVDHIGPGGAGHYVKMVHNGIEYGDMQLIAEAYDVLRTLGGLEPSELSDVFAEWNRGDLQSFLIEITSKILQKKDDQGSGRPLVDLILDATGMKGTGKWTVQQASELAAPIPTIASSVEARILSAMKAERVAAGKLLKGPAPGKVSVDKKQLVDDVRHALYASKICSYAQGFYLMQVASRTYEWSLKLGRIARIWKGGCIIRAQFLDRIKQAYERAQGGALPNLLCDTEFTREIADRQSGWRRVIGLAVQNGLPMQTMMASLAYYDSYRRERLPANLTQAQRDFFGAHTYQRTDRDGTFHTDWS
jgi:6-phosphogluconate dehydrogenase